MSDLKVLALDGEDLSVISAHMQDSVFKLSDVKFDPRIGQFCLSVNRFVWEDENLHKGSHARCRSFIAFKRVSAVRSLGLDIKNKDLVHSLLAIRFSPKDEGPDGTIELTLSGHGAIALDVECIEVQLSDISGAWETNSKPEHQNI